MKNQIKKLINGKKQDVKTYKKRFAELEEIYGANTPVIKDVKDSHLLFEDKCKIVQYIRPFVADKTAQDMATCNQSFTSVSGVQYDFVNFENGERFDNGNSTVKHIPTYHCGNRFCPFCSAIYARKKADKILKLMALDRAFSNHQLALGTLTVGNLKTVSELRKLIKDGNEVINSFSDVFDCKGTIKKIEMTYNRQRKDYHLHFHVIMAFAHHDDENDYLSENDFAQFWCTQMGQKGFKVNVKAQNLQFIDEDKYIKSAKEVAKYEAKSDDLANNGKDVFEVFYKVLSGRQTLTTSGCFYEMVSLINEDDWHICDLVADLVSLDTPKFNEWLGAQTTEWRADDWKYDDFCKLSDSEFMNKILPFIKSDDKRNYYLDYRFQRQYNVRFGKELKTIISDSLSDKLYVSKRKSAYYQKLLQSNRASYEVAKAYQDKPKLVKHIDVVNNRLDGYNEKIASGKLSSKQLEKINRKKDSVERELRRSNAKLKKFNELIDDARFRDGFEFEKSIARYKKNSSAYYRYTSRIEKLEKLQKLAEWLDKNLENILLNMIDFKGMKKLADDKETVHFCFNESVDFVIPSENKKEELHFCVKDINFDNFIKLFLICLNFRQLDFNFDENEFLDFSDGFERDFRTLKNMIVELNENDCREKVKDELHRLRNRNAGTLKTPKAFTPVVGEFSNDLGHYVGIKAEDDLPI